MIKEATASTFVFHQPVNGHWRLALIWHPRLEKWMPAGGHVECDENAAQAALREIREETGLAAQLIAGPSAVTPCEFPHQVMIQPWWIAEVPAYPDSHTNSHHVHIDHVFLALAGNTEEEIEPAHQVRWFTEEETLTAPEVIEDSRIQAGELFRVLPTLHCQYISAN